ncbi:hypothetical protein LWI29_005109 [Acer saccharum]|uniref:Uncharacterized protein n=1 Tax=Acer saccharum TaxID=4024 RepID=A0AA39VHK4_ACESA|nr:hypothetical protein LWI29_005109 [Acer saccharum]
MGPTSTLQIFFISLRVIISGIVLGFEMGISYKEERFEAKQQGGSQSSQETTKTCMVCLWSLLVSLTGGLILGFWEYHYHQTNSQLWMIPFSLIMLVTPVMVWFAVLVSDVCNSKFNNKDDHDHVSMPSKLGDSVHDPEK